MEIFFKDILPLILLVPLISMFVIIPVRDYRREKREILEKLSKRGKL
jgi:hypothetical protein